MQRPIGRIIDLSVQRAGVSSMTYFKGREIIKNAPEEVKDRLRKGTVKIDKVFRRMQRQQKKQELITLESTKDKVRLEQGDFIEKSKEFISDNSIYYCLQILFMDPNIYRYMII